MIKQSIITERENEMNYTIYQPKQPTFRVDDDKIEYEREDYKNVYCEFFNQEFENDIQALEYLFEMFNIGKRPANYDGRSMSVGDIVVLKNNYFDDNEKPRAYICATFGWNKIELNNYYH